MLVYYMPIWSTYFVAIWYSLWPFWIFYGYLEHLLPLVYDTPRKIWQPWRKLDPIERRRKLRPVHRTCARFFSHEATVSRFCRFGESLRFGKIWGQYSACFDLTEVVICYFTTKVSNNWPNARKLILIYYQNFILQSGTSTTLSIWRKSMTFT
jgi:hypothetical protein